MIKCTSRSFIKSTKAESAFRNTYQTDVIRYIHLLESQNEFHMKKRGQQESSRNQSCAKQLDGSMLHAEAQKTPISVSTPISDRWYVSGVQGCSRQYMEQCDYGEQQNKTPHQCEYPRHVSWTLKLCTTLAPSNNWTLSLYNIWSCDTFQVCARMFTSVWVQCDYGEQQNKPSSVWYTLSYLEPWNCAPFHSSNNWTLSLIQYLIVWYVSGVCKDVHVSIWVQCDYGEQQNKTPHQCSTHTIVSWLEIAPHRLNSHKAWKRYKNRCAGSLVSFF